MPSSEEAVIVHRLDQLEGTVQDLVEKVLLKLDTMTTAQSNFTAGLAVQDSRLLRVEQDTKDNQTKTEELAKEVSSLKLSMAEKYGPSAVIAMVSAGGFELIKYLVMNGGN